jgi:hypothetical protein
MRELIAQIDADSIIYKIAWVFKDSDETDKVFEAVDNYIKDILNAVSATHYLGFLGNGKCFRYDLAITVPYKANRVVLDWVEKWKEPIKKHMVDKWFFILLDRLEADDAVSICQRKLENTIICGQDKDLLQVPGSHYDYVTKVFTQVDELGDIDYKKSKLLGKGEKFFWGQMITGDSTDNIQGLKGKGPAFATKFLKDAKTVEECRTLVKGLYLESTSIEYFNEQYSLLRLLETEEHDFIIPTPIEWKVEKEEEFIFNTDIWQT